LTAFLPPFKGRGLDEKRFRALPPTDDTSQSGSIEALSFEAALQRLEAIVRRLESGDAPLESAIDLYAEAQALKAHCEAKLSSADARIAQLQLNADGQPVGEVPLAG
jgi:exodeoxyribonuclease VII small subunit